MMYLQVILNLVLVLFVAAIYIFLTWKIKNYQNSKNTFMEVISQMQLGQKEKIVLVKVENRKILLGVTASNISALAEMSENSAAHEISMSELTSEIEAMMEHNPNHRNIQ